MFIINKYRIIFCILISTLIQIHQSHLNEYDCEFDCSFSDFSDCIDSMDTHFGQTFNKSIEDVHQIAIEWCKRKISHDSLNKRTVWDLHYDYIVVGGGTAGIVVSARLAEDSSKKILIIEAGGPQSVESDIPAFKEKLLHGQHDWNFQMKGQKKSYLGYLGNTYNITKGKAFGGCSMHNDMNYYRENPEFFDYWTQISGVKGWTWSDVLPYFKKSENNLDDSIIINSPNDHVRGGPLAITTAIPNDILKFYMKVAPDLGYPHTYMDGREPLGSAILQKNILDGVRQSTGLVFLEMKKKRNLHILGQTLVTKILFNEMNRAVGVKFYRNGKTFDVWVRKEIIISAGSIGSSKLLMLSGIGPKEHLRQLKIPVMSDLNVGQFLYDFSQTISFDIKNQSLVEKPNENYDNYRKYFIEKRGPLAYSETALTAFNVDPSPQQHNLYNGLVLTRIGFIGTDLEELVKNYKLKEEWREYYRPYLNRTVLKLITELRRPGAKGTIRLASADPFAPPMIDPCKFCNQQGFDRFIKLFKKAMNIFMSPAMSPLVEPFMNPIPGCTPCADEYFCETYIECIFRTNTDGVYPNGGCPMGVANDGKSVVDERLRVFGVSGLRVIDSSVMPINTQQSMAVTIMIGEYGADLIKNDNQDNKRAYFERGVPKNPETQTPKSKIHKKIIN